MGGGESGGVGRHVGEAVALGDTFLCQCGVIKRSWNSQDEVAIEH